MILTLINRPLTNGSLCVHQSLVTNFHQDLQLTVSFTFLGYDFSRCPSSRNNAVSLYCPVVRPRAYPDRSSLSVRAACVCGYCTWENRSRLDGGLLRETISVLLLPAQQLDLIGFKLRNRVSLILVFESENAVSHRIRGELPKNWYLAVYFNHYTDQQKKMF